MKRNNSPTPTGGFTLLEIMIVVVIIGLLAVMAVMSIRKAIERSQCEICRDNRRVIYEQICIYSMETGTPMTADAWPNLCAARDTLAPGGDGFYLSSWKVFECPLHDGQDEHDYTYVFDGNGQMIGLRCGNTDANIRDLHNNYD